MLHVNSRGTTFENSLNINARPPPVLHVIARNWQILEFIISWPFALVTVFMSIPSLRLTCNQAVIPFLSFQRRVEKEKFADVVAFPEVKKKEHERLVVRSRRSDGGDGWSQVTLRPSWFLFQLRSDFVLLLLLSHLSIPQRHFSDHCNPILAVTTGESMRIPDSTPTLPVIQNQKMQSREASRAHEIKSPLNE